MEARVTAIEARRGTRARRIFLDGEPWRSLPAEVIGATELFVDDVVDVSDLETRIAEVEPGLAYRRALGLLSRRDYSITSLTERLRRDGYSLDAVDACVTRLRETKLLDDVRYAEALVRSLRRRGLGGRRVALELTRRGLEAGALEHQDVEEPSESERAFALARKLARQGDEVPRLTAKLVRRGFDTPLALQAARAALNAPEWPDEAPGECSGEYPAEG